MNLSQFVSFFSRIGVVVNWPLLFASEPEIVEKALNKSELLRVKMPWYATDSCVNQAYDSPNSRSLSVGEAARRLQEFPRSEQSRIESLAAQMTSDMCNPLIFPAYELPESDNLLLDGNHRAVALAIRCVAVDLTLLVIRGPIDRNIIPDLEHWENN